MLVIETIHWIHRKCQYCDDVVLGIRNYLCLEIWVMLNTIHLLLTVLKTPVRVHTDHFTHVCCVF